MKKSAAFRLNSEQIKVIAAHFEEPASCGVIVPGYACLVESKRRQVSKSGIASPIILKVWVGLGDESGRSLLNFEQAVGLRNVDCLEDACVEEAKDRQVDGDRES